MGKRKCYNDIEQFWREAPQKLKNQVKGDITERGYNVDPTGGSLSAHLWESGQWEVSYDCCAELIAHYAEVKRQQVIKGKYSSALLNDDNWKREGELPKLDLEHSGQFGKGN